MNNINLVPKHYEQSFRQKWYIGGGVIASILGLIALSYFAYLPVQQMRIATSEQAYLDQQLRSEVLADVRMMIEEMRVVEQEKADVELNLKAIDTSSPVSRKTMDIIVANAPRGVRISQMTIDRQSALATVQGSAEKITNVAQYMAALYNIEQFQEITYTTNLNKDNAQWQVEYELQIQMELPEEEGQVEEVTDSIILKDIEADDVGSEDGL